MSRVAVKQSFFLRALSILLMAAGLAAFTNGTPIPTDSRIKTFVYNENDVYRVLTYIGYQMNIEFGRKEQIQTISVGDRTGWQIIPSGGRLFIRAMEREGHTNMTVVTDKRAYQFDLYSAPPGKRGWDQLVYVVRFYYPEDEQKRQMLNPGMMNPPGGALPSPGAYPGGGGYGAAPAPAPLSGGYTGGNFSAPPPAYGAPAGGGYGDGFGGGGMNVPAAPPAGYSGAGEMSVPPAPPVAYGGGGPVGNPGMNPMASAMGGPGGRPGDTNYNYTFTGNKALLPNQMFDDGRQTYLQYTPGRKIPHFFAVGADGSEQEVRLTMGSRFLTAPGVFSRVTLRQDGQYACVYNELKPQL